MRAPVAVGPSRDRHTTSAPRPHSPPTHKRCARISALRGQPRLSSTSRMSWPGRCARAQPSFVVFNRRDARTRALSCPDDDYVVSRPACIHQDAARVDRRRTHAIDHNRGRDCPCGDSTDAVTLEPANDIGVDGLGTCRVGLAAIKIALLDQCEPSTIKGVYCLRVQM